MKLDVNVLRYLSQDDFRVLTAVEMGMRNHEIVPSELVDSIAHLRTGGTYKVLKNLLKHKLLHHDSSKYDGFRLTYLGYDFLAIRTMAKRGVFVSVGRQIGVGKESDIFEVGTEDGRVLVMKLHRLGRTSFRAVKSKRDYLRHRSCYNWLYLSRLAALKEFAFMKALEENGFPVPNAVDSNRHCVVMSLVKGYPLVQVKELQHPGVVLDTVISIVVRLAECGLIHCDFNEFNIMIDDDENITVIDFPQMVSVSHRNAQMYFERDINCLIKFFKKRFNFVYECTDDDDDESNDYHGDGRPCFSEIQKASGSIDKALAASGFNRQDHDCINKYIEGEGEGGSSSDEDSSENEVKRSENKVESLETQVKTSEGEADVDASHGDDDDDEGEAVSESHGSHNAAEGEEVCFSSDGGDGLRKQMGKQRRRVVMAARNGGRKSCRSRNYYKEKGNRSTTLRKGIGRLGF